MWPFEELLRRETLLNKVPPGHNFRNILRLSLTFSVVSTWWNACYRLTPRSLVNQGAFAIARKVSYRVRKFKGVCCPLIFMFGVVEQGRSIFSWGWKILYRGLVGAKFLSPGFRKSMTLFRLCLHFEWESQLVPNNTVLRFHDALLGFSFPKVRLCFAISVKAWSHS